MSLGPQFDPKTSEGLTAGTPIIRGEKRFFVPTVTVPDPSADPIRALREHITGQWIRSGAERAQEADERDVESVGTHWTLSSSGPMVLGRRDYEGRNTSSKFIEPNGQHQRGVPMSRDERLRIVQTSIADRRFEVDFDSPDIAFRDLSGPRQFAGESPDDNAAAPFTAQIIWHGRHNPAGIGHADEFSTEFEKEITYEHGTPLDIVGASLHVARPGEELANPWVRGALQNVQFSKPIRVTVGRNSRGLAAQVAVRHWRESMRRG